MLRNRRVLVRLLRLTLKSRSVFEICQLYQLVKSNHLMQVLTVSAGSIAATASHLRDRIESQVPPRALSGHAPVSRSKSLRREWAAVTCFKTFVRHWQRRYFGGEPTLCDCWKPATSY